MSCMLPLEPYAHTHTPKDNTQYQIRHGYSSTSPEKNFQSEVRSVKVVVVYRELSSVYVRVSVYAFTAG